MQYHGVSEARGITKKKEKKKNGLFMFLGMKWWNCLVWVHIDSCPDYCSRLNWLSYLPIVPSSDSISRIWSWIPNLVVSSVWSEAFRWPSSPTGLRTDPPDSVSEAPLVIFYRVDTASPGRHLKMLGVFFSVVKITWSTTGFWKWDQEHTLPEMTENHPPPNTNSTPTEKLWAQLFYFS